MIVTYYIKWVKTSSTYIQLSLMAGLLANHPDSIEKISIEAYSFYYYIIIYSVLKTILTYELFNAYNKDNVLFLIAKLIL